VYRHDVPSQNQHFILSHCRPPPAVSEFFAGHRLNRPETKTNRRKSNNGRFVGQKNCPLIVFGRSGAPSAVHAGACTGNVGARARGRVGVRVRGHACARLPASAPTRSLTCSALSVLGSNCGVRGRGALLHHGCCQPRLFPNAGRQGVCTHRCGSCH